MLSGEIIVGMKGDSVRTAIEIMPRGLGRRLQVWGSGDESNRLGVTPNGMLERIGALVDNLQMTTDDLIVTLRFPRSTRAG